MKHAGGAAKIFKYRGMPNRGNELEQKLLLSLRGPVVSRPNLRSSSPAGSIDRHLTCSLDNTNTLLQQTLLHPIRMEHDW